ncbi:MAG TPA: hypothetical protein PK402_02200 [Tepidisphaeraceae bacterium]|nr:hypothetical protein [Tepidisphaeraceae bacterium]
MPRTRQLPKRAEFIEPLETRRLLVNLAVNGTSGPDTITVSMTTLSISVTINGVTNLYNNVQYTGIVIDALGGVDSINLNENGDNPTTIGSGAGVDTIYICSTGRNLDAIDSPITVLNDSENLYLYDDANTSLQTYAMTSTNVARASFAGISFNAGLFNLYVFGSQSNDTFNVESSINGTTFIDARQGQNIFNLTPVGKNLDALGGAVQVTSLGSTETLRLYDQNNTRPDAWTMSSSLITRSSMSNVTASSIRYIHIYQGSGSSSTNVTSSVEDASFLLDLGAGNDSVSLANLGADSYTRIDCAGGNDVIELNEYAQLCSIEIHGGIDNDELRLQADASTALAVIDFHGDAGIDKATMFDHEGDDENYYVEPTEFGKETRYWVDYELTEEIVIYGSNQFGFFSITGTGQATVRLFGGAGTDIVGVSFTDTMQLTSMIEFDGGEGSNYFTLNNETSTSGGSYSLTDTYISGNGFAPITLANTTRFHLRADAGNSQIDVVSDQVEMWVNGREGEDAMIIRASTIPVTVIGGPGLDYLFVDSDAGAPASARFIEDDDLQQLNIGANSSVILDDNVTLRSNAEGISGTLTLNEKSAYISVADTTPLALATARTWTGKGYNNGAWNGINAAINSTHAATSPANDGIAYGRPGDLGLTNINGYTPGPSDVVFTVALYGDTNADGTVNFNDLLRLSQNYGTGLYWFSGDFNYSGTTNFDDLLRLSQNYGLSAIGPNRHRANETLESEQIDEFRI